MKIHGQNLSAIIRRMPWQYQVMIVAGVAFIVMTVVHVAFTFVSWKKAEDMAVTKPLHFYYVQNAVGLLEPSMASRPHGLRAWMAYTIQKKTPGNGSTMQVRLAYADPLHDCRNWSPVVVDSLVGKRGRIIAPDGQSTLSKGRWSLETPSLVYDPDDKGKEWKLFAFKYFWADNPQDRLPIVQHYGVITYQYAHDPAKHWSTEEWLFSAKKDYPPPPYDQMVLLNLDRLSPDLHDIVMYARPSAIYKDGVLAMTLSAFKAGSTAPDRVIMIVSRDQGNSWLYVGTLLDKKDLPAFDVKGKPPYTRIFGATMIKHKGKVYLAAALGTKYQRGAGTLIFGFDDLAHGKLRLDPKTGMPAVLNRVALPVAGSGPIGGGIIAYTDVCPKTGMVISEQRGMSPSFRLYQTGRPPIPPSSH